jgi:hypothetical protein
MDTSSILGIQGRTQRPPSPANSSDFADELNKDVPRGAAKSPHDDAPQGRAGQAREASTSETLPGTPSATSDESASSLDPLAVSDTRALSAIATVEQVLSARVFGLHLQASGYLSEYRLASANSEPSTSRSEADAMQAEEVPASLDPPEDTTAAQEDAPGLAADTLGVAIAAAPEIATNASTDIESVAGPLSGASTWREVTWQQRALRLFARPDGKHTAWLRDYTVSTDEARQLAKSLAQQLKGQGMALHSIIWNGHEVWSSMDVD